MAAAFGHRVVLCADDFGLTEGVSLGIVDLLDMGRLSATSAMTTHRWWPRLGPILREAGPEIGVGLHLNFTSGAPLGPLPCLAPDGRLPSLGRLIGLSLRGGLDEAEVGPEIERQLDAFMAVLDRPPDFVDGHQHVHVLPGIRRELLRALSRRGLQGRLWLRDPSDDLRPIVRRRGAMAKAATLKAFALGFRRAARAAGFETNEGFSGFSAFDPARSFEREMHRFVVRLGRKPVVMCHPGYVDDELRAIDPVVETRSQELMYLSSRRFEELLEALGLDLVPWPSA
ncbi:ChbG/HpnK family deacetylase [Salinarimonas soli]|uniref:ChbG/HpnK family deacetylase n=1 Tax=Salinarimonas soli TaxID=1638099 RepID=A0A5B2V7Y5_9HYPH|nr:ChbG/HpnK family deacetylase [Salinarimonas soli]KAA2234685.1 ChbG/HpnK family deacetylase [Salinarimonas soli]